MRAPARLGDDRSGSQRYEMERLSTGPQRGSASVVITLVSVSVIGTPLALDMQGVPADSVSKGAK